jgi:hypothetical protein
MLETELIPFGKYRGMPVEAVLEDRKYADWLIGQAWFREKYQNLFVIIQGGGAQQDFTPEHNRMQARFLDKEFSLRFLRHVLSKTKFAEKREQVKMLDIGFEVEGWDVVIPFTMGDIERQFLLIELKPSISDDFPVVLRQVKSRRSSYRGYPVVLCDIFDSSASVSIGDVKKMFFPSVLLIHSGDFS